MNIHGHWIMGELVSINQAAGEFVVGVGWQAVVHEELRLGIERLRVSLDELIDLCAGRFRPRDCVSARQSRKVLSKTVTCDETMKVSALQAETCQVVPASHVLTRRR